MCIQGDNKEIEYYHLQVSTMETKIALKVHNLFQIRYKPICPSFHGTDLRHTHIYLQFNLRQQDYHTIQSTKNPICHLSQKTKRTTLYLFVICQVYGKIIYNRQHFVQQIWPLDVNMKINVCFRRFLNCHSIESDEKLSKRRETTKEHIKHQI